MNEPLSIGIIGAGDVVSQFHLPILNAMKNITIAYVAGKSRPTQLGKKYNTRALSSSDDILSHHCDAILVALPLSQRGAYFSKGMGSKPLLVEKPFAQSRGEHDAFLKRLESRIVFCNYNRIYYRPIQYVSRLMETKTYGKLRKVMVMERAYPLKRQGERITIERGCHTLSQLSFIANARLHFQEGRILYAKGEEIGSLMELNMGKAHVSYTIDSTYEGRSQSTFFFEKKTITFDHTDPSSDVDGFRLGANTYHQSFYLSWKSFLEIIQKNMKMPRESTTFIDISNIFSHLYEDTEL